MLQGRFSWEKADLTSFLSFLSSFHIAIEWEKGWGFFSWVKRDEEKWIIKEENIFSKKRIPSGKKYKGFENYLQELRTLKIREVLKQISSIPLIDKEREIRSGGINDKKIGKMKKM